MTFLGFGLMTGNAAAACAPLVLLLSYFIRIAVEENALKKQFGEAFKLYRKRTWALLPLIW